MDLKFPSFKHWSVTLLTNYSDHWNTQKFIFSPQSQLEKKTNPYIFLECIKSELKKPKQRQPNFFAQ